MGAMPCLQSEAPSTLRLREVSSLKLCFSASLCVDHRDERKKRDVSDPSVISDQRYLLPLLAKVVLYFPDDP